MGKPEESMSGTIAAVQKLVLERPVNMREYCHQAPNGDFQYLVVMIVGLDKFTMSGSASRHALALDVIPPTEQSVLQALRAELIRRVVLVHGSVDEAEQPAEAAP